MGRALALIAGFISAFFVFYTIRLLVVTSFLTRTRAGGGGAFVGAIVFPFWRSSSAGSLCAPGAAPPSYDPMSPGPTQTPAVTSRRRWRDSLRVSDP